MNDSAVVEVYGSFDELPPACLALLEAKGGENYFHGLSWFRNLADTTIEEGATLRIYATDGAVLVARTPAGQNGSIFDRRGVRTLASMTNHQTVYYAPLVADASTGLRPLAERIAQERWTLVDLNKIPSDSPLFGASQDALRAAGFVVRPYFYAGNAHEAIGGRFYEDFLASRPSRLRNTLKRRGRKLERSSRVEFDLVAGGEKLEEAFNLYEQVVAGSWKEPEPFPRFTEGLVRACAADGALRLGTLRVDGEPAAAQIWIVAGGRATIFKLSYDERFKAQSVGTLLTARLMEHVIDADKVAEVDFGTHDDAYKATWLDQRRELWGLAAFNPRTLRGSLGLARYLAKEAARRALDFAKPVLRPPYRWLRSLGGSRR